jgi:small-conductance mechanosensitive channel
MRVSAWVKMFSACAALVLIGGVVGLARQQVAAPDTGGSLTALTAEVRLLRLSVEKSADNQAQLQAMTVYLSAQQSRLLQVSARADALRKDLDAAILNSRRLADKIAGLEKTLAMPLPVQSSDATQMRRQLEEELPYVKRDLAQATSAEAELRNREADATTAVQSELARWTDMLARLEQATRR